VTKMNESDIVVRLIKLPGAVRGYTCPSFDGTYNVYINQNLPFEMRNQVIRHEIAHIKKNDFGSDREVADLETDLGDATPEGQ